MIVEQYAKETTMNRQKETMFARDFWTHQVNTAEHDEILRWLDGNMGSVLKQLAIWPDWTKVDLQWYEERAGQAAANTLPVVERMIADIKAQPATSRDEEELRLLEDLWSDLVQWSGLGDPTERLGWYETHWELPVVGEGQVVGLLDMKVEYGIIDLRRFPFPTEGQDKRGIDPDELVPRPPSWYWLSPGKGRLYIEVETAIPDLNRVVAKLRTYQAHEHEPIVVVSPDDRYANELESQGIPFVRYMP
jgi:hypothetical protein